MKNQVIVRRNKSGKESPLTEEQPYPTTENFSLSVGNLRLDIEVAKKDKYFIYFKECREWLEEGKIYGTLRSLKNIQQNLNTKDAPVGNYFPDETTGIEPLTSQLESNLKNGREKVSDDIRRDRKAFLDEPDTFLINR